MTSPPIPLRLAILGCDDDVMEVCRAAHESGEGIVVAAYDARNEAFDHRATLLARFPAITFENEWEALLVRDDIDVVVISGANPAADGESPARTRRAEQLKKLAQEKVPLLVAHPACEPIIALEVEMIRSDVGGVIVPMTARSRHPAVDELARAIDDAPAEGESDADADQIVLTRRLNDRTRGNVLRWLTQDFETLKRLIGPIVKLSAVGPALPTGEDVMNRPKRTPSLAQLVVSIQGESKRVARWIVEPGETSATLAIDRGHQRWRLDMPESDGWSLASPDQLATRGDANNDWGGKHLATLREAIAGGGDSRWFEAARTLDAVASIDSALSRGRSIEFHNDEISEQSSFKAVMAVWGCLLLVGTVVLFFGLSIPIQMFAPRNEQREIVMNWRYAQFCLLVPFVGFIALQLLLWGISKRR